MNSIFLHQSFVILGMVRNFIFIFLIIVLVSCKNDKQKGFSESESINGSNENKNLFSEIDLETVPKDTLVVSGKEIVFFLPSKEEYKLIEAVHGKSKKDSLFRYYTNNVEKYLKYPEDIKVSFSTARIIGLDTGYNIKYYDKLDYFKCNYAMLLMFNQSYKIIKGVRSEKEYYSIIDNYYRDNIHLEKTIEGKYVVAKNGLNIRDAKGFVSDNYDYGDYVEIIGYTKDSVEIEDNGKIIRDVWAIIKWKQSGFTKQRYVFNGFLGDIKDIKVFEDQLCYGYYSDGDIQYNNNRDIKFQCLTDYLDFKLISEKEYNSIKPIHESFLKINPLVKIEENEDKSHNIELPIKDSTLVYKSKVDYSASSHNYLGDIDFLNQYLVYNVYYKAEETIYTYIDRTTGKQTYMFPGLPHISPNKDYLVCFYYDIYENRFFLYKYSINGDKITLKNSFEFFFWIKPADGKIKWISNKEFTIEISNKKIWNGSDEYNPQYLKIRFKD